MVSTLKKKITLILSTCMYVSYNTIVNKEDLSFFQQISHYIYERVWHWRYHIVYVIEKENKFIITIYLPKGIDSLCNMAYLLLHYYNQYCIIINRVGICMYYISFIFMYLDNIKQIVFVYSLR